MDVTGAIAIIFFFVSIATVVGSAIFTRHRERMAIIDKGVAADDIKAIYQRGLWRTNPLSSLKWGILAISVGVGLFIGLRLKETAAMEDGITIALMAICGGIGLVVFYLLARKKAEIV